MPYEIFLAFRYLRSRSKRRLARVTAVMAILGITMGVAALIVALALANGFRDEMRDKILQGTAHLTVLRTDGRPIADHAKLVAQLRTIDGVVSASATTYDGALASPLSKQPAYAVLRGIEKDSGQAHQLPGWITEGSLDPIFETPTADRRSAPQVLVGAELAARLGLSVGDTFFISLANEMQSSQLPLFRVAGIFRSGLFEYDSSWIYLAFETAASFGRDHAISVMSVQVSNPDNVKQVAANVLAKLGHDFTTVDWQQANQPLFNALALERRMGLFIIGLIVAIAALNITTMLILVVVERRRDIAILSTLGATRTGVMLLFIIEGATVGAIGAIAGVLLGLAACVLGNHYKLVSLPSDVYSISHVPLNARLSETLLAALIAFGLSVLATIYPARNAAGTRPVEVLRDA